METVSPLLMGHGVRAGMSVSAAAFIGVSLVTRKSSAMNLAPFFKKEADALIRGRVKDHLLKWVENKIGRQACHASLTSDLFNCSS